MKTFLKCLPLTALLLAACGGASDPSIDRSTPITSLTDQQRHDYCAWLASALGGEGKQYDCNGQKGTVSLVSDCVAGLASVPAACSNITYGEVKDCADEQVKSICTGFASAACQKFARDGLACSMMSSNNSSMMMLLQ